MAPQVRLRIRNAMGRQMGLQKTGNLDLVYDMQPMHQDPDCGAFIDQKKIYRQFVGQWPEALARGHVERLANAKHRWQVAKGPVAAMQCYLRDKGWNADSHMEWSKPGVNGDPDFKLNMQQSWYAIKSELKRAEEADRLLRISTKNHATRDSEQA